MHHIGKPMIIIQGGKKPAKYTILRIMQKSREEGGPNDIQKETMGSGWTSRGTMTCARWLTNNGVPKYF